MRNTLPTAPGAMAAGAPTATTSLGRRSAAAAAAANDFRGLSRGGLRPAYLAGSTSPFSSFWEAWIICSKMARVGERHALHVHEELPVQGGEESPPSLPAPPPPPRTPSVGGQTAGGGVGRRSASKES